MELSEVTGDRLVQILATLANPHRVRILAALAGGQDYVSRLARELGISRALLQVHLRKLETAGLVTSRLVLSEDGKAMKYYDIVPFSLHLTPEALVAAALSLTTDRSQGDHQ
ncbi:MULTISPECIES: ArsR family transcriptional regulator [unclassified Streptomyces]|uniref:ArsR/SmtB family transcription factor n=1 Tax=unclassified Streptomyces TaxID=2593676 RepID=UPI003404AD8A